MTTLKPCPELKVLSEMATEVVQAKNITPHYVGAGVFIAAPYCLVLDTMASALATLKAVLCAHLCCVNVLDIKLPEDTAC